MMKRFGLLSAMVCSGMLFGAGDDATFIKSVNGGKNQDAVEMLQRVDFRNQDVREAAVQLVKNCYSPKDLNDKALAAWCLYVLETRGGRDAQEVVADCIEHWQGRRDGMQKNLREYVGALAERSRRLGDKLKELQDALGKAEERRGQLETMIPRLTAELSDTKRLLDEECQKRSSLSENLTSARQDAVRVKKDSDDLRTTVDRLASELARTKEQFDVTSKKVEALGRLIKEKEGIIGELEGKLADHRDCEAAKKALMSKVVYWTGKEDAASKASKTWQTKFANEHELVARLTEANQQATKQIEELSKEHDHLKEQLKNAEEARVELVRANAQLVADKDEWRKMYYALVLPESNGKKLFPCSPGPLRGLAMIGMSPMNFLRIVPWVADKKNPRVMAPAVFLLEAGPAFMDIFLGAIDTLSWGSFGESEFQGGMSPWWYERSNRGVPWMTR